MSCVVGQHVVSHDGVPNSNSVGLQLQLFPDANAHYDEYFDWQNKHLPSVSQWVQTPAVFMNQVLAVAEQTTRLLSPLIASVNPNNGPAAGGNTVTITGSNFIDGLKLFFGGQLASGMVLLSTTTLTVKVPSVAGLPVSKPVDVVIENPDGQQARVSGGYTYNSLPSITSIVPAQGPTATIQSATATKITVSTPKHAAGAVDVVVTTPDGSGSKAGGYTYVAAPTISRLSSTSGPVGAGTLVTITGTNLSQVSVVTFNNIMGGVPRVINDSEITVFTPSHSEGKVEVAVRSLGGSATSEYTYYVPSD